MARPRKLRRVCAMPHTCEFRPCGRQAGTVELTVDEYETIRLIDLLGLTQEACARQMDVARTTVQAIYDSARRAGERQGPDHSGRKLPHLRPWAEGLRQGLLSPCL